MVLMRGQESLPIAQCVLDLKDEITVSESGFDGGQKDSFPAQCVLTFRMRSYPQECGFDGGQKDLLQHSVYSDL